MTKQRKHKVKIMPDLIDKSNALEWASQNSHCERITRYCEFLSVHGSGEVDVRHLKNVLESAMGCVWICVEKTKPRQSTRSFEVYIMGRNFVEQRATTLLAAVCRPDRNGLVKVNFWAELEQAIKYIDPYATVRRF